MRAILSGLLLIALSLPAVADCALYTDGNLTVDWSGDLPTISGRECVTRETLGKINPLRTYFVISCEGLNDKSTFYRDDAFWIYDMVTEAETKLKCATSNE